MNTFFDTYDPSFVASSTLTFFDRHFFPLLVPLLFGTAMREAHGQDAALVEDLLDNLLGSITLGNDGIETNYAETKEAEGSGGLAPRFVDDMVLSFDAGDDAALRETTNGAEALPPSKNNAFVAPPSRGTTLVDRDLLVKDENGRSTESNFTFVPVETQEGLTDSDDEDEFGCFQSAT